VQLSFDMLEEWLEANSDALRLRQADGASVFRELALFQDYHGMPAFKNVRHQFDRSFSNPPTWYFRTEKRNKPADPIMYMHVVSAGSSAVHV
jgi:hypothetical protein